MGEGVILTAIICIGVVIYYSALTISFEKRVRREKIIRHDLISSLLMKSRLMGIAFGIGAAFAIVPGAEISSVLIAFTVWGGGCVWLFTRGARGLIERLKSEYDIK